MLRGAGVCGAIFKAAEGTTRILQEYIAMHYPHGIEPGQAVITPSFNLNDQGIKNIIHAVGPVYPTYNDKKIAQKILRNAYSESLSLAIKNSCNSLAFPFISSGIYGYPKEEAAHIAIDTLIQQTKKQTTIKKIYFALIMQEDFDLFKKILEEKSKH
jgi:O-acetyl-ADP-ribose deacetylase